MRATIRLGVVVAMVLSAPSTLLAQVDARTAPGRPGLDRPEFDYFVSRYRGAEATAEDGADGAVGARIMWPLARYAVGPTLLQRASLGGYVVHSPDEEDWSRTWRYGAQADLRLTRLPVAGRVDPLISLGLGASRVEGAARPLEPKLREPLVRTHLSVAPGVGLRFHLAPGLGVRGDARQVLDFGDGVQRNLELSGGLSMGV